MTGLAPSPSRSLPLRPWDGRRLGEYLIAGICFWVPAGGALGADAIQHGQRQAIEL
jgi:hypothetical protein